MNLDEITDIQSKSKSKSGPWSDPIFFPEMCRKTVARLHAKQLPQSSDLVAMFAREDNENGALPPQQPPPLRINSVTGTLDEFGAGHMPLAAPEDRPPPQEEPPGSQESGPPLDQAAADTVDSRGGSDTPIDAGYDKLDMPVDPDPVQVAYDRGREQKKKGHTRRAIPPEYRESSATREALAWYAGFDGTSPPP
jgi:recombination protein RecT